MTFSQCKECFKMALMVLAGTIVFALIMLMIGNFEHAVVSTDMAAIYRSMNHSRDENMVYATLAFVSFGFTVILLVMQKLKR